MGVAEIIGGNFFPSCFSVLSPRSPSQEHREFISTVTYVGWGIHLSRRVEHRAESPPPLRPIVNKGPSLWKRALGKESGDLVTAD